MFQKHGKKPIVLLYVFKKHGKKEEAVILLYVFKKHGNIAIVLLYVFSAVRLKWLRSVWEGWGRGGGLGG